MPQFANGTGAKRGLLSWLLFGTKKAPHQPSSTQKPALSGRGWIAVGGSRSLGTGSLQRRREKTDVGSFAHSPSSEHNLHTDIWFLGSSLWFTAPSSNLPPLLWAVFLSRASVTYITSLFLLPAQSHICFLRAVGIS